jgi:hypothetical protein
MEFQLVPTVSVETLEEVQQARVGAAPEFTVGGRRSGLTHR